MAALAQDAAKDAAVAAEAAAEGKGDDADAGAPVDWDKEDWENTFAPTLGRMLKVNNLSTPLNTLY